jgi:hypothetical protein
MTLNDMRPYVFIEPYITINKKTHAEEKVILITCRTCERQKVFPEDAPLSMIEPYVQECIACREEGRKH